VLRKIIESNVSDNKFAIDFPDGFDEFAWEVEAKGWLPGVIVTINRQRFKVTFYDPSRFAQTVDDELRVSSVYLESNILVVSSVTRANIENAIASVTTTGRAVALIPDDETFRVAGAESRPGSRPESRPESASQKGRI
jgi:hypothetical protein